MKKEYIETAALRKKAEEKLDINDSAYTASEGDAVRLIHELEVHQVELEMQNEELREAIDIAETATARFTMLYDFAPNGYFTLDNECLIRELNFNGASMLCNERANLVNANFKNFIGLESCDVFNEFYRNVIETGLKQICEVRLAIQDDLFKYVHLEGISSDSKQGCLITAVDLTERQRAAEELKENEARLKDLNATKDKFFSIIAHDLRGPFTTIIGFSGLLMEQIQIKNYEGIEKYAAYIQQSSQRAMNLLTNLLEWARLQTGKIKFNPGKIQILEIADEVTALLQDTAQQKNITLIKRVSDNIHVFADKEMISIVLRNLITNAIKFTHSGGNVSITAVQTPAELTIVVSDNGIGITEDSIKKLFLIEGNQSKKGTENEIGTGLGLILCKEFILLHGGKIWVESTPGQGSSFYFTIPNN